MRHFYLSVLLNVFICSFSQVGTTYTFSQQNGTFTPITPTAATVFGGGADDDQIFGPFNIGFPFLYNSTCYSQFCVANNGFIRLGGTLPLDSYNPISVGSNSNVISVFGSDIMMGFRTPANIVSGSSLAVVQCTAGLTIGTNLVNGLGFPNGTQVTAINGNTITCSANATVTSNGIIIGQNNGQKTYQVLGSAPNRTLVVQWLRARKVGQVNDCFNFQARLEETTNAISFVYGTYTNNLNSQTFEIGLRGVGVFDYNSRSTATNWGATVSSTVNTGSCLINNTVIPAPGLTFKWRYSTPVSGSTVVCGTSTNVLTATGATSYSWSNGATTASIAVSPSVNTVFTVNAGYTGGCVSTSTVPVVLAPNPTVTASGPSTVCSGNFATLSASGANTYSWNNGATGATVSVSPPQSVTYAAIGTNTASGCSSTATLALNVIGLPTVNISGSLTVCSGQPLNLAASGADSWMWSNGSISASINPVPPGNTTYSVTGTSSLTSCSGTAAVNVTVIASPTVAINGSNTVCMGQTVNLSGSGASTYSWSNGSQANAIGVSPTVTSSYSVIGTATNGCTGTAQVNVTVNSLPSVSVSATPSAICVNTGTVSLNGNPAGGTYSGPYVSGNTFNPLVTGTFMPTYAYTSTLTGCTNTSNTSVIVFVCTDEKELSQNNLTLTVYPNPGNGEFFLRGDFFPDRVLIFDLQGRIVLTIENPEEESELNMKGMAAGIYLLSAEKESERKIIKLVIQ